jgi:hypothetical protein
MINNVYAEPVEQNGSWVPSRLRNRLQESMTVCTGRVIPAGICSTGSVYCVPLGLDDCPAVGDVSRSRRPSIGDHHPVWPGDG